MTLTDIRTIRLFNQKIVGSTLTTPAEIVSWMVAMQAQEYAMAKWAIGLRLPGSTDARIEEAFNKGEILRTHVMRPTWHFVHPADIRWLQQLTSPRVNAFNKNYFKKHEIDAALIKKSNDTIIKTLTGGKQLTRTALQAALNKRKIKTDSIRLAYLMMQAELDGIICSGSREGKQFTYALLEERVPAQKSMPKEEALATLVNRYFRSRGPATANDFSWWSGLSVKECREALALLDKSFVSEKINGSEYFFLPVTPPKMKLAERSFIMPDYDEYGIAYKDRSAGINEKIISLEEIIKKRYLHLFVIDGVIAGRWSLSKKSEGRSRFSILELRNFGTFSKAKQQALNKAADRFHSFTQLEI